MSETKKQSSFAKHNWKRTTCLVCGKTVDYLSKRPPKTCKGGDCEYKYHYKIDEKKWVTYQPNLFDPAK